MFDNGSSGVASCSSKQSVAAKRQMTGDMLSNGIMVIVDAA